MRKFYYSLCELMLTVNNNIKNKLYTYSGFEKTFFAIYINRFMTL